MHHSTTVGVDLAKNVIQVSVVSARGKELLNRSFTRRKFAEFLGKQQPSLVAFESCASAHYWARAAKRHGHQARIIPAKAVAPFRQGHKTDSNDALAVAEAAGRPTRVCRGNGPNPNCVALTIRGARAETGEFHQRQRQQPDQCAQLLEDDGGRLTTVYREHWTWHLCSPHLLN